MRKPDETIGNWAIWYGPKGANGEVATTVEKRYDDLYEVSQYQHVDGYLEEYDPKQPFLKTTTVLTTANKYHAASAGIQNIAAIGGSESFVASLGD